ncbi:MAG: hypothetical protein RBU29_04620 [bacterium]|jgi:uncharacterized repeat protein (TIGR04138 family)|nr:hypothetical protein [bacterium]
MDEGRISLWIHRHDSRYYYQAYLFVLEALKYTQDLFNKERHVTGQELLVGITRMAKEKFGELAMAVFQEWGITCPRDFGNIVFNLVEMGEIKKTEEDSIDDFDIDFDFQKELKNVRHNL